MDYSKNISYGNYYHSELYQESGVKSGPPSLIRVKHDGVSTKTQVNYGCCTVVSLDKYMAYMKAPFDELNFIDSFSEKSSTQDGISLRNLNVCSFFLCDYFSEESIRSFTPQQSYRYDVPYRPLSNVHLVPLRYAIERTKSNSRPNQRHVFPRIFELYDLRIPSSTARSACVRQGSLSTIRHSLHDVD